jgi:2-iminobutanoate/2-iminopropanoate deaminase
MEPVYTKNAPDPIGPYNQAIKANGFVFISGQIPIDPQNGELVSGSIEKETEQVMKNLENILLESGSSFDKVVKTSIFIKSMDDFGKINTVYGNYFKNNQPARETVEVSALPKNVNIEISCIALV